jgi:hypothetical protein
MQQTCPHIERSFRQLESFSRQISCQRFSESNMEIFRIQYGKLNRNPRVRAAILALRYLRNSI